jgi:hypothetical protein
MFTVQEHPTESWPELKGREKLSKWDPSPVPPPLNISWHGQRSLAPKFKSLETYRGGPNPPRWIFSGLNFGANDLCPCQLKFSPCQLIFSGGGARGRCHLLNFSLPFSSGQLSVRLSVGCSVNTPIVTSLVQWRNFEITIEAPIEATVNLLWPMTSTIEGNNYVGSRLNPLLKNVTL